VKFGKGEDKLAVDAPAPDAASVHWPVGGG